MNPRQNDPVALAMLGLPQNISAAGSNDIVREQRERQGSQEEPAYDPVPPKRSLTVSVRYRIRGRGQPLPYPVDEGDDE